MMKQSLSLVFLFTASFARGFQTRQQQQQQHRHHHHQQQLKTVASSQSLRGLALLSPSGSALFSSSSEEMESVAKSRYLLEELGDDGDGDGDGDGDTGGAIRNIVDDYDVFLLDMWGVMHDGKKPYEGVPEVVQKLKDAGKKLIILSNSSKRRTKGVKILKKLGFPDDAFDEIITSGEVAHHLLKHLATSEDAKEDEDTKNDDDDDDHDSNNSGGSSQSSWVPKSIPKSLQKLRRSQKQLSAVCFGSGDGDEDYLNSCGIVLADSVETADLIVARGTFVVQSATEIANKNTNKDAYWATYEKVLEEASSAASPIPMVVCNPDKVRPDADKSPMPGTIAVAYRDLIHAKHGTGTDNTNGNDSDNTNAIDTDDLILSLGKPFSNVYDIAMSSIASTDDGFVVDKSRVIMVGDALETDVTGATTAGIDSAWVIHDGIHNEAIAEATSALSSASVEDGCESVLRDFHDEPPESTYARGRKVSPTVVVPHFRW